jgi:PAS domain S-box-containing protein
MTIADDESTAATDVLMDVVPAAVVAIDRELRVRRWNAAAEVLYGHRRDAVVGRPFVEVLFELEDRDAAAALVADAVRDGGWEGDRRVRRADGHLLVSSFRLAVLGGGDLAWIATDGMDQGLAEQERSVLLSAEHAARQTAEEALGLVEAILASAPVGIAVFDLDLRYVRVNAAYAELSGIPADDHIGGRIGEIVGLPLEVGADLRRVVATGERILQRPVHLDGLAPGGDVRDFHVSYFPVRTASGALVGAGLTLVEVTEARRAEAERAVLLERAEKAHRRLAILATASTVVATTMQVDELLDRLARVLTPGAADWCIIETVGDGRRVEHVAVSHRNREAADEVASFLRTNPLATSATGPIASVLAGGEARLLRPEDVEAALADAAGDRGRPELASGFSLRSSVIVPIEARGNVLGVLVLSTEGDRVFDEDDLDLAVEIGHRAALALGNAKAFQQEHQIAESLQRSLLPETVGAVAGIETAVRYVAATDGASVGGDWYDVIGFDDGTVGVVVGDVVGHDIAASSAMGQLRSTLRAFAFEDHSSPDVPLRRLDRLYAGLRLTYATCVLGIIDPVARSFRWSSAGHPPPLVVRNGVASLLETRHGAMLGVAPSDATPHEMAVDLEPGDFLVLYTDGLVERRRESLDEGLARLVRAASGERASSAEELCTRILDALLPSGAARGDDVAILVAGLPAAHDAAVVRLELPVSTESPRRARRFVHQTLTAAGWGEVTETAELLVSELVTNAVRYGASPIVLQIEVEADAVEVGVSDADPSLPVAGRPRPIDVTGRGLGIVDAFADAWGTRTLAPLAGKTVWFSLRRPSPSPPHDGSGRMGGA